MNNSVTRCLKALEGLDPLRVLNFGKKRRHLLTRDPEVAEQVAIALATLDDKREVIFSDSRLAIRAFERAVFSYQVLRTIRSADQSTVKRHIVIWFPSHLYNIPGALTELNESAHGAARALTDRAVTSKQPCLQEFDANWDALSNVQPNY